MELTHLRYFQTVAQAGSLTRAAQLLGISQPTLTVAVRNLEERLKTTLLIRERSGVSLTATGRELLAHITGIFAAIERAEQSVAGLESEPVGQFVLGCHESLGAYFLPGFMPRFLQRAPRVELSLWNGPSRSVQEAVVERRVHFGIVVNAVPHPDLVLLELFHDAVDVLISAEAHPGPSLEAARERLRQGPLIHAGRVMQSQQLIEQLAHQDVVPSRLLSCGDLELVKSLALAGVGVALLPRRVAAYGHPGKLVRLHPEFPFFPDTISLVFRADVHRTRAAMLLKEALVAYGRTLDDQPRGP